MLFTLCYLVHCVIYIYIQYCEILCILGIFHRKSFMESSCHFPLRILTLLVQFALVGAALVSHRVMCVLFEMRRSDENLRSDIRLRV